MGPIEVGFFSDVFRYEVGLFTHIKLLCPSRGSAISEKIRIFATGKQLGLLT